MLTGPLGPVEFFFYRPEAVLGNFYWPGASGSLLVSSLKLSLIDSMSISILEVGQLGGADQISSQN